MRKLFIDIKSVAGRDSKTAVEGMKSRKNMIIINVVELGSAHGHHQMLTSSNLQSNTQKSRRQILLSTYSTMKQSHNMQANVNGAFSEVLSCCLPEKCLTFTPKSCSSADCGGKQGEFMNLLWIGQYCNFVLFLQPDFWIYYLLKLVIWEKSEITDRTLIFTSV